MIIKLADQPGWSRYKSAHCKGCDLGVIQAVRINKEDFMFETRQGWVQGYRGQWLVELGKDLRCNLDHEAFMAAYQIDVPKLRKGKKA